VSTLKINEVINSSVYRALIFSPHSYMLSIRGEKMDSNVKIIIGERIRQLRVEKGWSQEELAHRADLHPSHMGQIERGEKSFTIDSLEKVINALDITFEELFRFINPDFKGKDTSMVYKITNKLINRNMDDQKAIDKLVDILLWWKDR